nr:hypothetical protein [uncultured Anaerosporobacter sp.]
MATIQKKLFVLSELATKFNNANITWAIGASMLLFFKGYTSEFHDIDIMVSEEDDAKLKEIMLTVGELQPQNHNEAYKTKCFLEFVVDGVDIDVMAGFTIVNKGKEFYYPLKENSIHDYIEVNGVEIPLGSIKEWRNYYSLMGREEKVKIIDRNND